MGIYSDFIEIQRNLPPLVKDTQGHGYKYPTLNQLLDIVLPKCHELGLGLIQVTHPVTGGGVGVETVLFNGENERLSSGVLAMPLTTDSDGNIINVGNINKQGNVSGQYGAQAYGSALTYARRYSLTAFFAMKAEDDDGYKASQPRLDVKKVEKAMRSAPDIATLDKYYFAASHRATEEQMAAINAVYEEIKQLLITAQESKDMADTYAAQTESKHSDFGDRR